MELLVVIAIIGVLVALLLPAVQAAREAARLAHCKNNLYQIGLAMLEYESTHHSFPTGGWSHSWIGDPNQGTGPRQPGGWIYQSLPHLEQQTVAELGSGLTGDDLKAALSEQGQTVIPMFHCPSRRPAQLYGAVEFVTWNFNELKFTAKTDYAANAGSRLKDVNSYNPIPLFPFVSSDCHGTYPNCTWTHDQVWLDSYWDGIVGDHSGAKISQITDGTSNTLLVGEKWLYEFYYDVASIDSDADNQTNLLAKDNPGDNGSMYAGFDYDNVRICGFRHEDQALPPVSDSNFDPTNTQLDKKGAHYNDRFGSAHATGLNIGRCDGSVATFDFEVDPLVWAGLGMRNDGSP